jgi:hypothetical protein
MVCHSPAPGWIGCETLSLYVPMAWKIVGGPPRIPNASAGVTMNDVIETKVPVTVASSPSVISQCKSFPHSEAGPVPAENPAKRVAGCSSASSHAVDPVRYDDVQTWSPERLVRSQGSPLTTTRPSASPVIVVVTDDIGLPSAMKVAVTAAEAVMVNAHELSAQAVAGPVPAEKRAGTGVLPTPNATAARRTCAPGLIAMAQLKVGLNVEH